MKYIVILALFLAGCGGGGSSDPAKPCKSAFYGDSIGVQLMGSVYAPDFDYFVTNGFKITDQEPLDNSYCTIYLELGSNIDHAAGKATEELALLNLIAGIEDKVICVLPMTQRGLLYHMRDMMIEHCHRIIDPVQEGVYPGAGDGLHLSWGTDNPNLKHYASLFH